MSTDQQVGRIVHGLMWDRRMSGKTMAGRLGIDESTMARKLRGSRKWTLDEVLTVADVLDVPLADLLPRPRVLDMPPSATRLPHLDSNQEPAGYQMGLAA